MNRIDEVEALPEPLRSRVQTLAAVFLAEKFVSVAEDRMRSSLHELDVAKRRAVDAYDHFTRATTLLEDALKLRAQTE